MSVSAPACNVIDLVGHRFGRLVVLRRAELRNGILWWVCQCDCGTIKEVRGQSLRVGFTKSCGCLRRERGGHSFNTKKHGMWNSPEYKIWRGILNRCLLKTGKDYKTYGARGITVCARWSRFENFFADMGKRPDDALSIERQNNDGPYSPKNCYWATRTEQQRNRHNNVIIEFKGERRCIAEWAEITGIKWATIYSRYRRGWTPEEILGR